MRLLSTRTNANDVAKHKNKGKTGQKAYEQRQLRLLITQTKAKEVPKHNNKCK